MNRRILIVEDEPSIVEAYRMILETSPSAPRIVSSRTSAAVAVASPAVQPFELHTVSTGEAALVEIEKACRSGQPFAGGFIDVKLGGGIDGIETIKRARTVDPDMLYCVVTAYQDRALDEIERLFGEDFADKWDYLNKPFSQAEILQKARHLASYWDRRKREREYTLQIEQQQDQLVKTERLAAIGSLARGIGHEFGNILHRIIGIAELAARKNDPAQMRQSLQTIMLASERAGAVVRNLQALVKMQTKRERVNLYEPLKECLTLVEHELQKDGIAVVEDWDPDLSPVLANRVEMGQVFLNLFINAMHAMETTGGTLTLRGYARDSSVVVEIIDTGSGISPEAQKRLFEPLFTTKGDRGSGIGLSVCRKILTNHSAAITLESNPGRGTTVRLVFNRST